MVSHDWSEEDFDWDSLNEAVDYIYDFCWKYGRFSGQAKEKFGQCRFYCYFGLSLHSLIYPKWVYRKHDNFPSWLWKLDIDIISPLLNFLMGWWWYRYQYWIYREAYKRAVKKWPHIKEEITCAADYPELLKGL